MSTTNPIDNATEWDLLQIKYGNYPERPKVITNEVLSNAAIDFAELSDPLAGRSLSQLDKLEDDVDEDELAAYRRARLEELKEKQRRFKFGSVIQVGKTEYLEEVTNASAKHDCWVVLHLYSNSKPICRILNKAFDSVSQKFGEVKFCRAVGSDVIENYPEANCPTVLCYKAGVCKQQISGTAVWGGEKASRQTVEWVLGQHGIIVSDLESDPRRGDRSATGRHGKDRVAYTDSALSREQRSNSSSDEEEEKVKDGRGYTSLKMEAALRLD